jgi:hypothetical protein
MSLDAGPLSVNSYGELESKIEAIPDGGEGSFSLSPTFSMSGYEGYTAGIEVNENTKVTITSKGGVLNANQDPSNPGGRLFAVHGTLIMVGVEMKNAVGVNCGGT